MNATQPVVELTHLRPRPGCCDRLVERLAEISAATAGSADQPQHAMLIRDGDHLFVVARYVSAAACERARAANRTHFAGLAELLVENHGPTYSGQLIDEAGVFAGAGRVGPGRVPTGIFMPGPVA